MRLDLAARGDALEQALDAAGEHLADSVAQPARAVLQRARERGGLSAEHTVVALAGATGSGKSSLLNALVGRQVAAPGVQRPTTSHPLAVVRGEGAGPLLDWLDVGRRVADDGSLPGRSAAGAAPDGMVLLDLPDHDSIVTEHRARADHVVERADLLVWVVDPQKYADAALHEHYLRPLAAHGAVTVVVLNQADRLTPEEQRACLADLRRLVEEDGLAGARVLAASAATGQGVDELARLLADAVRRRQASVQRWEADERAAAARVLDALGSAPAGTDLGRATRRLVDALEQAAGVPAVVGAV
ncbi:GTPase family protein, partial [Cellulomonas massiliensis]|uniref:GTPase family protein n=1 Tax=Cellulomonas massiliensis TaxID=1465811 RepID=UPI00037973F6